MGEARKRVGDWKLYAQAMLSFAPLCRVDETFPHPC